MEKSFWLKNWEENQIGFHMDAFNELLLAHIEKFNLKKESSIFVPLCGKSLDLIYLAKFGHRVIGLELSDKAVNAFFSENNLDFEKKTDANYTHYLCKNFKIEIFQGDFFELKPEIIGPIDFIYDRASLIALPEEMRARYSKVIEKITKPHTQVLLITTEYDSPVLIGPPFSVKEEEVVQLYGEKFEVIVLQRLEKEIAGPRFQEAGLKTSSRAVYRLIRK
jgi:thiopurine S-methyltransferase